MADKKISALTGATTPLAGTEVLPIVQSGSTVKVAVSDLTAGRAVSATQLTLTAGNVIPANGYGMDFSATPGTGTSELFADYEEGTWTPSLSFLSGSVTYTTQAGIYTKVGRLVTVEGYVKIATASSPSVFVLMQGLPFAPAVNNGAASILAAGMLILVAGDWVAQPRTSPDIRIWTFSAGTLQNPGANIQAGSEIWVTCSYGV